MLARKSQGLAEECAKFSSLSVEWGRVMERSASVKNCILVSNHDVKSCAPFSCDPSISAAPVRMTLSCHI